MNKDIQPVDSEYTFSNVPKNKRKGFWPTLMIMLGLTFFSASMWSGGDLGVGLSMIEFGLVVMAGNLILGLYTGLLGYVAGKTGLSTHLLARYSFGEKGSYLASLLLGATQVGWFGVGVAMFAFPVQKATGINAYVLVAIAGILMTATVYYGIKGLMVLSIIAVPSIIVLGSFSVYLAVNDLGGLDELMQYQPKNPMSLAVAITLCVGSFASAGTLTPDFVRFAKTKVSGFFTTIIAFFLGNSLMFMFGGVGAVATGKSDISDVMFLQGMIIPAILVLGLNIWTTNDNALYASSLGFSNITKITRKKIVIFNGVIGTILAMWLYNNFEGWLTFLGTTLPPIGAIILSDYIIIARRNYKSLEKVVFKAVNWIAIVAWIIGVILGEFAPGIPPINAMFGSAISYILFTLIIKNINRKNKIGVGEGGKYAD